MGNPDVRSGRVLSEERQSLELSEIVVEKRHRQDRGDMTGLMASMSELGLLYPIVLNSGRKLISGERRLEAAKRLGWTNIDVRIARNLDDAILALKAERDENIQRLDFTTPEAVVLANELLALEKLAAAERKREAGGDRRSASNKTAPGKKPGPMTDEPNRAKTRAAKAAGMSRTTYEHAKEIMESDDEECIAELERGIAAGRVYKKLKAKRARKKNCILVETATPLEVIAGEQYQTIVIDPPWDWGDEGDKDQLGRARPEYAAMSLEQLMELPVEKLAKSACHLYLWITNRSLPKGFKLLERWGFRYITALTWVKPSYGMGNYFRGSTEHILFGVRGSLPLLRNDLGTHFAVERTGIHSGKPPEFYALVETASPGPWLEMFARAKRPGWAAWGAEVYFGQGYQLKV